MKNGRKNNRKTFIFPIIALFSLTLCSVLALLLAGGEEAVYKLSQLNFVPDEKTVCIDPGHGGDDPGALGKNRKEKDDNLRLSLLVRDILTDRGYTVVMTRENDSALSLSERCKIANKARASLFVAIHRNSSTGNGKGMELWVHSSKPTDDTLLAENIMENLKIVGFSADRGINFGYREGENMNYHVNRNTKMPSCLLEVGFITSDEDNKDFDEKINEYAKAIADGIEQTLLEMNGD